MDDNDGIKLFEDIYNDIYKLKNQVYDVKNRQAVRTTTGEGYQSNDSITFEERYFEDYNELKEINELIKNNEEIKNLFKIILENLKVLMSKSTIEIQEKKSNYFDIITEYIDLIEEIKKDVDFKLENASFFQKRKLNKYIKYCDQILELLKEIESSSKEEKEKMGTYGVYSPIEDVEYAAAPRSPPPSSHRSPSSPPSPPTGGKRTRRKKINKRKTKKYKKLNKRKTRKYRK